MSTILIISVIIGLISGLIAQRWQKKKLPSLVAIMTAIVSFGLLSLVSQVPYPKVSISITSPKNGTIVGMNQIVQGTVSNSSARVYVLVHPLSTNLYWVQNPPVIANDGSWQTNCYLGTDNQGIGEEYKIVAIAFYDYWFPSIFRKSKKLETEMILDELPLEFSKSQAITIRREK